MKILLTEKDNMELRGDLVPFIVQRSDLMAMPSTLECLIRVNKELDPFIKQGKVIALANPDTKYRIIYTMRKADGVMFQGNPDYQLVKVIAVLESCYKLTFLAEKAVIKENTSMAAVFRASGATIAVNSDVAVDKFTCLVGEYPTYSLMRALGRTATVPVWDGKNSLSFTRLRDLFNAEPVEVLHQDITQSLESGFMERHEAPSYYSNTSDGGVAKSNSTSGRRADFEMFADQQVLNNLSTYLITRKVWTTGLTPNIMAGNVIQILDEKFVVITATHAFAKAGSGSGSQMSRFWLGSLSNVVNKTK